MFKIQIFKSSNAQILLQIINMSCQGCAVGADGSPKGCKSNGGCSSGGCNRLNTYDWLSKMDIYDPSAYEYVEVSFKNGSRKGFYKNEPHTRAITGDTVVVEAQNGHDIGKISLSGELVRLQMKKKRTDEKSVSHGVIRRANERDLERLHDARSSEKGIMVRSRVIARSLGLEMKIGDVEFQGDKRKATFYYVADGRVDFRELIRHFAKEFKVKIEMRQIGARQESARIGGIGSCGRELCCSTWLTDFKSVSTTAARYQNLAINQSKLSGQCGRLKCCLNYELDTYMEALEDFPKGVDSLYTQAGKAVLVKTDIFKRIMYFAYEKEGFRGQFYPVDVTRVKEIAEMNKSGEKPLDLQTLRILEEVNIGEEEIDFDADLTGIIELPPEKRRKKRRKRGGKDKPRGEQASEAKKKEQPKARSGREERKSKRGTRGKQGEQASKPKSNSGREERRAQRNEKTTSDQGKPDNKRRDRRRGDNNKAQAESKSKNTAGKPTAKEQPKEGSGNNQSRRSNWKNRKRDNAKGTDKPANNANNKSQNKQSADKDKPKDTKPTSRRDRRNKRRNRNNNDNNKGGDKK